MPILVIMRTLRLVPVAIAIVGACLLLGACDSIDPTAASFGISFRNDLGKTADLKLCADDECGSFHYSNTIEPGELYPENISDRNLLTRWLVSDKSGRTVGCLPLRFDGKYEDVVVLLSQAVVCPGERPLKVQHGRRTVRE